VSYKASATSKTLEVLKLIANTKTQLGVSEIARLLSINKSTAFGILRSLHQGAYVFKDVSTKKYAVGDELVRFSRMISEDKGLAHVARPYLESLAASVDETVFLGVCESAAIKVIDVIEAKKSLTLSSPIGTKLPITAGAAGKAYLASLRNEEVIALLREKGLTPWTTTSIIDIDRFLGELGVIRKDGFALDREEYIAGVCSVASLITAKSRAAGIIWVAAFAGSMSQSKVLEVSRAIKETAHLLTGRLASEAHRLSDQKMDMQGYPGWPAREGLAARKARLTPVRHHNFDSYTKA
jgi:DNA-binding IclR family transcriptional regulator